MVHLERLVSTWTGGLTDTPQIGQIAGNFGGCGTYRGDVSRMTHFYKGVGVGTFLHPTDLRVHGIVPALPGATFNVGMAMQHVRQGPHRTPCVSITRSYAVAESYARNGKSPP
jgi:hypothetical protein